MVYFLLFILSENIIDLTTQGKESRNETSVSLGQKQIWDEFYREV